MKTVLDSVHGTISIPEEYFEKIIDTPEFQRLRRIEQNSCRSVFPSARHDRFIHSLGVFHLGNRIAERIWNNCGPKGKNILPHNAETILETYKLACLLHDVGHTPFSHTFEEFFDLDKSLAELKKLLNSKLLNQDIDRGKSAAEHEVISAIVAVKRFRAVLSNDDKLDWELLVRMITGYRFLDNNVIEKIIPIKSFENAMIELIHGDIIDADGLDYVCRDVWAGGYKNFKIDLSRLINSIFIDKDKNDNYSVLYKSKALNEIETVLNVKNFQYLYVIKHHKVLLEQYILKEAMKTAAQYHLDLPKSNNDSDRENALRTLCDISSYYTPKVLKKSNYVLIRPTDDDFVVLMKLTSPSDNYINQWFSRSFYHTPLWKSKLEFFNIFKPIFTTLATNSIQDIIIMLMSPGCKDYICNQLGLQDEDIITIEVKPKLRSLDASKINVLLNNEIYPFSELNHDMFSVVGNKQSFCYFYVNFDKLGVRKDKMMHRRKIIEVIKDFIAAQYRIKWKN